MSTIFVAILIFGVIWAWSAINEVIVGIICFDVSVTTCIALRDV